MWQYNQTELMHYGKKGMRWGQRRAVKKQAKTLKKNQDAWDDNVKKNWHNAYNAAADHANKVLIPQINKKYKGVNLLDPKNNAKYEKEYEAMFDKVYQQKFSDLFGDRPS